MMMIKSLKKLVLGLTFSPSPFDNNGVVFCIKLRLKLSDIDMSRNLTVNALEGFLDQLKPLG